MSKIMNSLIATLKEKLLPEFKEITNQINRTIPNVSAKTYGSSSGSLTEYQGYSFFIDCIFTGDIMSETDNVCLTVELCHITTSPRISADVGWGHPSGYIEAEFYEWHGSFTENGLKVSDKVLEDLYKILPQLYEALFEALKRRKPGNE
jgi:hypothetical protein